MIIGIDIDDTICTTSTAVCEWLNERLGTSYSINDITTYSIENMLPPENRLLVSDAFTSKSMWKKLKMITDAAYYIQRMYNEGNEIYFITTTLPENMRKKENFLNSHFTFFPDNYVRKHTIMTSNKQLINCDILIDDNLDNLTGERNYYSICLDYPWNKTDDSRLKRFSRAKNWEDVYHIYKKEQILKGECKEFE